MDLYLGFDLLGAASDANLMTADGDRTVAVHESAVPTGRMVVDTEERPLAPQLERIDAATRREHTLLDAQALSERLFGDHMMANTLALGAAYQRGLLPVSLKALEQAIRLNGAAVDKNLAALAWGRAVVAAPDEVERATRPPDELPAAPELSDLERELVDLAVDGDRGELRRIVEVRVPELVAYQNSAYARRYAEVVRRVQVAERERTPASEELVVAVARNLFKLMAYKDEYEVARLHPRRLRAGAAAQRAGRWVEDLVQPSPAAAARDRPQSQAQARPWFTALRALRRLRRLRGTWLDPFGYAKVRRVERALVGEYEQMIDEALERLTPATHATAVELRELPEVIRGEEIKLRNVFSSASAPGVSASAGRPAPRIAAGDGSVS